MRAPAFWNNPRDTWQSLALSPLGALYGWATARRVARAPKLRPDRPIVCVGNINAGGTGKTPTVIALIELLAAKGMSPAVVSRGYGGALQGPVRVDPAQHDAEAVGDEPLLIAAFAPTWVAKERSGGVIMAVDAGADVILLDDGFQNPDVAKDVSIVVADAAVGFGNGRVLPAGPLREPVAAGLRRADAVLSIGSARDQERFASRLPDMPVPHLRGDLEPLRTGLPLRDLPVLAFAGIGRPEKFFRTLEQEGAQIIRRVPLGDHQPLTPALMSRLIADAKASNAQIVTTEKDAVRLPNDFRQQVMTVPVRLTFEDPDAVLAILEPAIRRRD